MVVFDGVHYSLSPSLSPTRRSELAAILDLNGAVSHPPYTHIIALPASHAHNNATNDSTVKLVTDRWVDRSIVMGKCQPEQYYSPDPAMIFSGVVACATDLPVADLEVLSAGITALGGQWRLGLTRDVTHLFALSTGSDKYNTALHFAPQTHMCIITPHWFDDAVRLGRRIPEMPYAWPDPPVLRPGMTLELNDDYLATEGRRKRKPADIEGGDGDGANLSKGEHVRVWAGRRILLSTSLEMGDGSRAAIEAGIQRAGGVVVPITDNADEDVEQQAVDECDVLVTRWRSGKSYFKAARASLLIGTLSWLFSVESSGALHSPLDSLLWYPTPRGGIPDLIDCEISITNYTGAARDYLKRLIVLIGAKFTPSMSQSNKVLVAGFQPSPKTTRALSWSIPVVNHTWLEDCFVEWRALTVGLERYIVYPPGVDFGKMLMTRHGGHPSSQLITTPRLSGGAIPGGRGIGVIDVQQEESRDFTYRACAHSAGAGLPPTHDAFIKTMTGDVTTPTESRMQVAPRGGSLKRTPSSALRAKKGAPVSTPLTPSVTGVFVDHVIEIPEDEDEDIGNKRATSINGKPRTRMSRAGSRATPRSVSTPSSVAFSWPPSEDEAFTHDVGGDSTNERGKEKGKGKGRSGVKNLVGSRTRPVPEEEDAPPPSGSSKLQPRTIQTIQTKNSVKKEAALQTSGSQQRRVNGMTIGSTPGLPSDPCEDEGSEVSRRVTGTESTTPVKSGMRIRPKTKSKPKLMLDGESKGEVGGGGSESGRRTGKQQEEVTNPARKGQIVAQGKEKGKVPARPPSPTRSPASPDAKNPPKLKRRLSVCVPPVPKDYFSSQSAHDETEGEGEGGRDESGEKGGDTNAKRDHRCKQLVPTISVRAVATAASTSTVKRDKPTVHTTSANPKPRAIAKSKPKPRASKERTKTHLKGTGEDADEDEGNETSMVVDTGPTTSNRDGPRRSAANKATTRLREEVMPDVLSFEKEQKHAKRRRSAGGESITSMREDEVVVVERSGKRRKMATEEQEEEQEEAEVEDAVSASLKLKSKQTNGKGKGKGMAVVGSDKDAGDLPAWNKPRLSHDKKGARGQWKESAAIRLMTTGVTLSDDVIKRITRLGVQMTTKPTDCTHLIAKGIVRTEKFLCAMPVLPYILREEWATASIDGGKLLPEKDYLLSDAVAEEKWSFKFTDAMARARGPDGGSNLFKQMTFYVTPKVSVDTKLLKNVVSGGGGQVQLSTPTVRILKGKANRFVVSCPEDKAIWRPLVQEGFKIYSPELVLRAALRQEIEWEREECLTAG